MISIDLIVTVVVLSMIAGVVDVLRQPGWAWRSADESRLAYLVLVGLVPIVGLGMYLFMARPKITKIAERGRAASLPFERFGDDHAKRLRDDLQLPGTVAAPAGFGSFGERMEHAAPVPSLESAAADGPDPIGSLAPVGMGAPAPIGAGAPAAAAVVAPVAPTVAPAAAAVVAPAASPFVAPAGAPVAETFYSAPASRMFRPPAGLTRPYTPKQRTSLPATDNSPTVPAGWKADPTGRHQFRYWDGSSWTENVADAGVQARDALSS
jgi:hypothetical protein